MDDRRRTPSDGKTSHCLWQGELKINMLKPKIKSSMQPKNRLILFTCSKFVFKKGYECKWTWETIHFTLGQKLN
jgi:hypothetical protein